MKKSFGRAIFASFALISLCATSACAMFSEIKTDTTKGSITLPQGITPAMANAAVVEAVKVSGLSVISASDQSTIAGKPNTIGAIFSVEFGNKLNDTGSFLDSLLGKSTSNGGLAKICVDRILLQETVSSNSKDPHEVSAATLKKIGAKIKDLFQNPSALKASATSSNVNLN